jgi:hypothetical protein
VTSVAGTTCVKGHLISDGRCDACASARSVNGGHLTDGSLVAGRSSRLAELEAVVEAGLQTFVEVGMALLEIRGERLYRETHGTFEDYCRERWGWSRIHAHRQIDAARVATLLPIGNRPANEAQARELVPLLGDEKALSEVWEETTATGLPVTAEKLRAAVGAHVGHNSGESEWYTPADYIAAATRVMGGVDLDPASTPIANEVVGASIFYTAEQNGLSLPWVGRIWMNPPYSQPLVGQFSQKLAEEYVAGNVSEACVLVNNATETKWFQVLSGVATALCFPLARVRFWHPERESATPLQGQAVLYFGPHLLRFAEVFDRFGAVVRRFP